MFTKLVFISAFLTLMSSFINNVSAETTQQSQLTSIDVFAWQKRIVVINQPDELKAQAIKEFSKDTNLAGINERYILWFVLSNHSVQSNYAGEIADNFSGDLIKRYALPTNSIVLIGYDGEIKYRSMQLSLDEIFQEIDGMPMRQLEMLRQQK